MGCFGLLTIRRGVRQKQARGMQGSWRRRREYPCVLDKEFEGAVQVLEIP